MNGAHDLGGMHGLGAIAAEVDEPVFHHEWERRVMALSLAAGAMGKWNIDMSRHARENQPPADYLASSYYQIWLHGLEKMLLDAGLATAAEIASGRSSGRVSVDLAKRVLRADRVVATMSRNVPYTMDDDIAAMFAVGEIVRVVTNHPTGHTRAPRYARGKQGIVTRDHGVFVFADENAKGRDNRVPQHIYSVEFTARELWGGDAAPNDSVFIDLWDAHLEAV